MILKKLPSIANVTPGGRFVLQCPVGLTYHSILFQQGGTTFDISHLSNLEVKINGKPVQEFATGQRLVDLNAYYGRPDDTANGFFSIHFTRPELNPAWRHLPALGTQDVDTLTVEGDIASTASAPTLEAYATLSQPSPLGAFIKVREYPVNFAAGINEWDAIPKGPRIAAIHAMAGDFTKAELELDGLKVFDGEKAVIQELQKKAEGTKRVPVAGFTTLDFLLSGNLEDAIITEGVQDRRIRLTKTAAGASDLVLEMLDGFQGI